MEIKIEMTEQDEMREQVMSVCARAALETFREGLKEGKVDSRQCYGFTLGMDEEKNPSMELIGSHGDVYDFLENMPAYYSAANQVAGSFMLGIFSQGWGAPIEDGEDEENFTPPSENENRRRVQLVHMISATGHTVSAVKIDGDDDIMINFNSGGGAMAEGMARCYARCMATHEEIDGEQNDNEGEK